MQNETYKFDHEVFGKLQVVMYEEKPYFIANEVCSMLGMKNPSQAMKDAGVLDEDKVLITNKNPLNGLSNIPPRGVVIITESAVYDLIMNSRKPEAKEFKRWVTKEVLPTIRKTGGMVSDVDQMVNTFFGTCAEEVKVVAKALLTSVKENQHKVDFFEAVANSNDCIDVGEFAKLLGTGRTTLFKALREEGYLMQDSTLPYGRYRTEQKWFKVVEVPKNGKLFTKTLVTPKGQIELEKRLRGKLDLVA